MLTFEDIHLPKKERKKEKGTDFSKKTFVKGKKWLCEINIPENQDL